MARDLSIVVTADTSQAEQAFDAVEQKANNTTAAIERTGRAIDHQEAALKKQSAAMAGGFDKLDQYVKKLVFSGAAIAAVGVAFDKLTHFAMDSIEAYAESERGVAKLTSALRAQQMATPGVIKEMTGYADALSQTSSFTDDAIIDSQRLLLQFGVMPSKMKPATQAVADLAAGLGIDLAQAAGIVGKALDGNTSGLKRYGVEIDAAAFAANGADEVFGRIEGRFGGQAQADLNTYTGKVQSLKKAFGELQETVGKFLVTNPLFQFSANTVGQASKQAEDAAAKGMPSSLSSMWLKMFGPMSSSQAAAIAGLEYMASAYDPNNPSVASPAMSFNPGGLPNITSGFGVEDKLVAAEARKKKAAKVLPFVRGELMGETDWNSSAAYQAQWYNAGMGGGFPGWSPMSGQMEGGIPMVPYASMTATQNRPNIGQPFMQSAGGRLLGTGLGMATSFIPGMNQQGSMIGSGLGSALGGLKGITSMMGSFAPMLAPIMGIAGGLIGKLFNGEGKQVKKDRGAYIDSMGGMGALTTAAQTAGVSLDGLMGAKKKNDLEAEIRKLEKAMGDFNQKVQDTQGHLDELNADLDNTLEQGKQLGYNFDKQGNLVSVSWEKMSEKAKLYGLDMEALGPTFQKQRLHESATEIINDFELLSKGGTDTGTILVGMKDEISALVRDSIKFGTDIPANMKPWIDNLLETHQLTDENGIAMENLGNLKFAAPIETEFDKISTKISELIDSIAIMVGKLDELTRPRTVEIGYNVAPTPDIPTPDYNSMGGLVKSPRYLAGGGWIPRGTDTVPAMLTPGEGVMNRGAVSRLMRGDWPQGGNGLTLTIENVTVESGANNERDFEVRLGKAMISGLKRRGVRLNAA